VAPYFDEGYEAERERYYTAAVREGFGARPEAFRAVAGTPGLSWHTSALGLTLHWQQNVLPAAARAMLRAVEGPARSATKRAVREVRAVGKRHTPRVEPRVWLIERIPDDLFLRILERLHYPLAAFEGARAMWRELSKSLRDMTDHVRAAGHRFLGDARLMRDRLRAGGLLPGDREMLDVLALGAVGNYPPPPGWLQGLLILLDWIAEGFRRPRPPVEDPEPPGDLAPGGLRLRSRFHLFGLELETLLGEGPVARSTMGMSEAPAFHFWAESLPAGLDLGETLGRHSDRWRVSHNRRQVLYRLGGKVLSLVLKYMTMGPVGLIVSVLHLLAEGLLDVVSYGRRLMWPANLPQTLEG
jgi:hypothetical protein